MRVLIYGGGAVGLGVASCLLKSAAAVDIIARKNTSAALKKSGLIRTGIFGDFNAPPTTFGSYAGLNEIAAKKPYDYILACTKSFDSTDAAKDLSENSFLFDEKTKIVLFQNGWGNTEIFCQFFDKKIVYNARVITGFSRPEENEVVITVHAEPIHIGSLFGENSSNIENLCEVITNGGVPCQTTQAIEKDLWAKMLYNCALNPLGAILDVPYGVLAKYEFTRFIMNGIVAEIFEVLRQTGYKTHWQKSDDFLRVFYGKLVPDTAEHKSSTLQDILAKKKTEIDALNGAVIKLAQKYQVNVPYNSIVYNMVKFIEAKTSGG
jgi:2-dehydropantoate 2-reductase